MKWFDDGKNFVRLNKTVWVEALGEDKFCFHLVDGSKITYTGKREDILDLLRRGK